MKKFIASLVAVLAVACIANAWDQFSRVARSQGTYAGVKYSLKQDLTFEYNGYRVVATNATPELVNRVLSTIE